MTNRRKFLGAAAAMAVAPKTAIAALPHDLARTVSSDDWNVGWVNNLKGKYRAVFDNTEPESGYGVWRAAAWAKQYMDVLNAAPADVSPAIVLRHNAIMLAMQQPFWDKYGIGTSKKVTHPLTMEVINRNPALLDEKDGIPLPLSEAGLMKQLSRGVTVLACNFALQDCADLIARTDKVSPEDAYKRAVGYLVPGIILQPSGVFAVTRAQEAGASYVKAS
jgi:hypothetical protein